MHVPKPLILLNLGLIILLMVTTLYYQSNYTRLTVATTDKLNAASQALIASDIQMKGMIRQLNEGTQLVHAVKQQMDTLKADRDYYMARYLGLGKDNTLPGLALIR